VFEHLASKVDCLRLCLAVTPSGIAGLGIMDNELHFFHGWPFIDQLLFHRGRDSCYTLAIGGCLDKISFSFANVRDQYRFVFLSLQMRRAFAALNATGLTVSSAAKEEVAAAVCEMDPSVLPTETERERAAVWKLVENGHALQSVLQDRRSTKCQEKKHQSLRVKE
jgi:hypothetical protein